MKEKLLEYIDKTFDGVITRPLMYGSMEAREVLVLSLLEMRRLVTHPEEKPEDRKLEKSFQSFIYRTFYPDQTCKALYGQVKDRGLNEEDTDKQFTKILAKFINEQVRPENDNE
jgi:hypothetical protein